MFSFYFARNFNNLACSLVHGYSSSKHSTARQLTTFCAQKEFRWAARRLDAAYVFYGEFGLRSCSRAFPPVAARC